MKDYLCDEMFISFLHRLNESDDAKDRDILTFAKSRNEDNFDALLSNWLRSKDIEPTNKNKADFITRVSGVRIMPEDFTGHHGESEEEMHHNNYHALLATIRH